MDLRILCGLLLLAPALSGCVDSGSSQATGTLHISLLDTVTGDPVVLSTEGAWGLSAGEAPAWYRAVDANNTWQMVGSGSASSLNGTVPAGAYQGIRLAFNTVERAGTEAILVESGFDLPLGFNVNEGQDTTIEVGFAWEDALFQSKDGLAFRPALKSLRILEGDLETESLSAQEIAVGGTKPPVARMRVFDPTGLEVFESDFVAESKTDPVIANPGNITFAASASEALQPEAEIETYEWLMPDGTVLEGVTVEYPLTDAANQTVRLTVTDSAGGTDSQSIMLAVRPPAVTVQLPLEGTLTGVWGVQGGLSACGTASPAAGTAIDFPFEIDPLVAADGQPALGLGHVRTLVSVTSGHPAAAIGAITSDGAGSRVHGPSNSNFPGEGGEDYTTQYPAGDADAQPEAGTWNVHVYACSAVAVEFEGFLEASWLVGEPGYAKWLAKYDDGHDHQH